MISYYNLILQAKEKYPWGTKTVKGKALGEIRWNQRMTHIVCDTVNLYVLAEDKWVEKTDDQILK